MFLAGHGIPFEIVPGVTAAAGRPRRPDPLTHRGSRRAFTSPRATRTPPRPARRGLGLDRPRRGRSPLHGGAEPRGRRAPPRPRGQAKRTPAAAIEWATLPRQRVVVSTLACLAADAGPRDWSPHPRPGGQSRRASLLDRLVLPPAAVGADRLVTRATAQAGTLARTLESRGAWAVECPSIRIEEIGRTGRFPAPRKARSLRLGRVRQPQAAHLFLEGLRAKNLDARALAASGSPPSARKPRNASRGRPPPRPRPARHTSEGSSRNSPGLRAERGSARPRGPGGQRSCCRAGRKDGRPSRRPRLPRLGLAAFPSTGPFRRGLPGEAREVLKADRADAVLFASGSAAAPSRGTCAPPASVGCLPDPLDLDGPGDERRHALGGPARRRRIRRPEHSGLVETLEKALQKT